MLDSVRDRRLGNRDPGRLSLSRFRLAIRDGRSVGLSGYLIE